MNYMNSAKKSHLRQRGLAPSANTPPAQGRDIPNKPTTCEELQGGILPATTSVAHCRLPVLPPALTGQPHTLLLSSVPTATGRVGCHLHTEACILFHFSPCLPRHPDVYFLQSIQVTNFLFCFCFFGGLPAHSSLCCCAGQQTLHVRAGGA